ncbi:hypothetical protein [Anaerotardibacter muris]|uniref:hypothetical protein n=1 Tax=Anaerotardibacter muris TaxID=2941505 RepID=UPI0020406020|nr:hypothetical protein [Anaerotardibacter muris]
MAGAPAYRYDTAVQQPVRERVQPSVRVVPGQKQEKHSTLSNFHVVVVKAVVAVLAVVLCIGFIQVGLASAAYSAASASSELRSEIATMRSEGQSLAVQKSLIASPSNLRTMATEELKMTAPGAAATITLEPDVVAIDASGNLSLTQSIAQAAALE